MRVWQKNLTLAAVLLVSLWLISVLGGPAIPLPTLVLGTILAAAVHELGHVFAASVTGLRITGVAIGSHEFDFATKRRSPRWNRRLNTLDKWMFDPPVTEPAKAIDAWRWTVLAGPGANLLLSFFLGLLNLSLFAGRPDAQVELALVACISAVVGVLSLVPKPTGLTASDGEILWRTWKNESAAENDIRVQQLGKAFASPVRPKDWPPATLSIADAILNEHPGVVDATARVAAVLTRYYHVADSGDLRGALPLLEAAAPARTIWRERAANDPIDLVIVLLARHYALWGNDASRARVLLDMLHLRSWVRSSPEWEMTTALVKLSKGDRAAASAHVALARAHLKPLTGRIGVVTMESGWLDKTEKRIANQMTAPAVAPSALKASDAQVEKEAVASHRPPRLTTRDPALSPAPKPPVEPTLLPEQKQSAEPRLTRVARNAWQDVAVTVNQSLMQSSRQAAVEYGEARSWLYRAPGVPVDTKAAVPHPWPSPLPALRATSPYQGESPHRGEGAVARVTIPVEATGSTAARVNAFV